MDKLIIFLDPKGTAFEVVRCAYRRGYKIIVFAEDLEYVLRSSRLYNADLTSIAEIIRIERWGNFPNILNTAQNLERKGEIHGIYANGDHSIETAAFLRQHYGLPTVKHEKLSAILDKFRLRKTLTNAKLSLLKHFHGKEVDQWKEWQLNGAGYFKPVRGTGSLFVARCENLDDVRKAKASWKDPDNHLAKIVDNYLHSCNDYYLDQEIDGKLFSVEGLSVNGEYRCLGIVSTIVFSENPIIEMGSGFPFDHPLFDKILNLVKKAHQVLEFTDGPSHTEIMVKGEQIEIIEINPRFIGADVLYSINHALDINIEEVLVDWITGKTPGYFNTVPTQYSCLQYIMQPKGVDFIRSLDFPENESIVFKLKLVSENKKLASDPNQLDVIGVYLTIGKSFDEAIEKSKSLQEKILINKTFRGRY